MFTERIPIDVMRDRSNCDPSGMVTVVENAWLLNRPPSARLKLPLVQGAASHVEKFNASVPSVSVSVDES